MIESTTFVIRLKDIGERQFRFPKMMGWKEAQDTLDPLLDEMDNGYIQSPVWIVRSKGEKTTCEEVKIYGKDEYFGTADCRGRGFLVGHATEGGCSP